MARGTQCQVIEMTVRKVLDLPPQLPRISPFLIWKEISMLSATLRVSGALALLVASALSAQAVDRNVNIHNNTGYTIYRFYSTNSGSTKWGHDVMGNNTLPDGTYMHLNFDNKYDYCKFDFRIELEDGTSYEERGVDVCTVGDFTFN